MFRIVHDQSQSSIRLRKKLVDMIRNDIIAVGLGCTNPEFAQVAAFQFLAQSQFSAGPYEYDPPAGMPPEFWSAFCFRTEKAGSHIHSPETEYAV